MVDPLSEFRYWRSLPARDRNTEACKQTSRYTPDDLIPPHHKGAPLSAALISEREGLIEWYQALAETSLSRANVERYNAFARRLAKP